MGCHTLTPTSPQLIRYAFRSYHRDYSLSAQQDAHSFNGPFDAYAGVSGIHQHGNSDMLESVNWNEWNWKPVMCDEDDFDQLWDTPELKRIGKRFRRDPYIAIPELLRAGRTVLEVAKAFESCGLFTEFGESYLVPETDVIHASAKNGAEWEIADVFHTRNEAAQRVADEIAAEITQKLTPGVDDFVEVETFLFGFDSNGYPVRVKPQTHIIMLPDAEELRRL